MVRRALFLALAVLVPAVALASQSTGTISGIVRDAAGGVVIGARVEAVNGATGFVRRTASGAGGEYSFPGLLPGEYDVTVEAAGFQRVSRHVAVETATTTRADFVLGLRVLTAAVTVTAVTPQMQYDSPAVTGLITQEQIQTLPLNGRSFLELAKLEPGGQSPIIANRNRTVVATLGGPAANVGGTRFTVDGGSVTSIGFGGAQIGFSQEVVREFQVSTVNASLSAGMTDSGAIEVVTRSGSNQVQGSVFYFLRDHRAAAYPALQRDPVNPDPFFRRQQFGTAVGGPVRRSRVFYFANWERTRQEAVATTTIVAPDFAHLSRVTANPLRSDLASVRVDARLADAHTAFVRVSNDRSTAFGPAASLTGGSPNAYPSNWSRVHPEAAQGIAGLTSVLRPTIVNDFRLSMFIARSTIGAGREDDCERCLGLGGPILTIPQAGLVVGNSNANDYRGQRVHLANTVTWQTTGHRIRAGVDWERHRERNLIWNNEPVTMTLFSPDQVRAYNARPEIPEDQRLPLPASFATIDDILRLPLQSMSIGVGEPAVAQENGGDTRGWNTTWLYAEDAWRINGRLTATYGLGWAYDGVLNHDLEKPALLAPLLGAASLGPTRSVWRNFAPRAGFAWTLSADGRTVVHAAAGRYYRPHGLTSSMDVERVALGPPGLGRQSFAGASIANPLAGIPGVPIGTRLEFRNSPTRFTGADVMTILPGIRSDLLRSLETADRTLQQIQVSKQTAAAIFPERVSSPSSVQVNAGIQRQIAMNTVISADIVYRRFDDVPQGGGGIDLNHFSSARGPAIRVCSTLEARDPLALCSRGPIIVYQAPYWFVYKGVLVRLEKRLSHGVHLLGSYAYSRNRGSNTGNGFDLDRWLGNVGPTASDLSHVVNAAGMVSLPRGFELGFNFAYASAPPFSVFVGGIDFNGDGTTGDLLPGTTVNAFNRGMDRADLSGLVDQFNRQHAGTLDAQGALIPVLSLPPRYSFGDNLHTLDLRLSRSFVLRQRASLTLIGEVFNIYNGANLLGHSGDVTSPGFGQPTSRATQVFGSGGPRSFQVAARLTF